MDWLFIVIDKASKLIRIVTRIANDAIVLHRINDLSSSEVTSDESVNIFSLLPENLCTSSRLNCKFYITEDNVVSVEFYDSTLTHRPQSRFRVEILVNLHLLVPVDKLR